MVKYECYRCGYTNNNKSNIIRHINRKKTCRNILCDINLDDVKEYILSGMSYKEYCENEMSAKSKSKVSLKVSLKSVKSKYFSNNLEDEAKYTCKYCNNIYMHKQSLHKHLKSCKEKKKDDTVKESMTELARLLNEKDNQLKEELDKRDKQINEQNKQIQELIKKAGIITTTNNIQNNFKLLNYKETDTSHLTENDYVRCLEHYNFCVPHLIRKIHFNPKKPENHNIYISNLKNSYVMIYMNNKWKVKNRDETISRVIDDKQIILEKKIQEWVESGIQYPKVMAKFSRYLEKREENDVINAIKEDIKLMLYNNRNMIIENNKKLLK